MAGQKTGDDNTGNGTGSGEGLVVIYNVITNRSVPIVFILVSSLIIANISCDQVGSANEVTADKFVASAAVATSNRTTGAKYDPLNMLREIYLDHNSKVITLLSSPSSSNPVQKFHPNGRYGRRSVDNFAEAPGAHTELAKLRFGGSEDGLPGGHRPSVSSLIQSDELPQTWSDSDAASKRQDHLRWLLVNTNKKQQLENNLGHRQQTSNNNKELIPLTLDATSASFQQEMNKLLKCNYSGMSNLFWCDS